MVRFIVALVSAYSCLSSDVADYFVPVLNKSSQSQMKNIDFIYMINLDERPEKYARSMQQLEPFGITPYRFSAVNGWNLSSETVLDSGIRYETWMASGRWATAYLYDENAKLTFEHEVMGLPGKTYYCHCMGLGAIGCLLSHLSILQDALDSGYQTIWIMEDDIEVKQDPHILSELIEELDLLVGENGWDVLFTDPDSKNGVGECVPCSSYAWRPNYSPFNPYRFAEKRDVGTQFRQVGARYGSYSMILRRSGVKKILNFLKCYQLYLPYDMEYTQPENIRLFTVKQEIVSTQPDAPSDNGSPNYLTPVQL